LARVYKGDSFSDLPDDYKPEHPFTRERVSVDYVGGMKWMSQLQQAENDQTDARRQRAVDARKILRASDAVIERSEHKGDWKVSLISNFLGFDNKTIGMAIHQLPPDCHTETHKHGQATIFVLSGRGYSIVEGERHDWQTGDLINVPAGYWHQHFNTDKERVSQHLQVTTQPLQHRIHLFKGEVEERSDDAIRKELESYTPPEKWWN
jgi:gentisate 1,2-dioxygenase